MKTNCTGKTSMFFPENVHIKGQRPTEEERAALDLCETCENILNCFSLESVKETEGIWFGTTQQWRNAVRWRMANQGITHEEAMMQYKPKLRISKALKQRRDDEQNTPTPTHHH